MSSPPPPPSSCHPGVCTWPGEEGAQLLLASLLRQPASCVLMQHLPLLCGYQAAFAAKVHGGAVLLLLVTVQLMPGAAGEAPDAVCQCFARYVLFVCFVQLCAQSSCVSASLCSCTLLLCWQQQSHSE